MRLESPRTDPRQRAADNALADIRTVAQLWDDYQHHLRGLRGPLNPDKLPCPHTEAGAYLSARRAIEASQALDRILRRYNPSTQLAEAQRLIDQSVPGKLGMNYPGPDEE